MESEISHALAFSFKRKKNLISLMLHQQLGTLLFSEFRQKYPHHSECYCYGSVVIPSIQNVYFSCLNHILNLSLVNEVQGNYLTPQCAEVTSTSAAALYCTLLCWMPIFLFTVCVSTCILTSLDWGTQHTLAKQTGSSVLIWCRASEQQRIPLRDYLWLLPGLGDS